MMKTCTQCKVSKSELMFRKKKGGKNGLSSQCRDCEKAYRVANRDRMKAYFKNRYWENREEDLRRSKSYYQEHKEEQQRKGREWSKTYKDRRRRLYKENVEHQKEVQRAWRAKNPDKVREMRCKWWNNNKERLYREARESGSGRLRCANRRALKKRATPPWADMNKIKRVYRRAAELSEETGIPHHVDHIIPLQNAMVCGLHVENNLQIITAEQNRRKSNKVCSNNR